MDLLRLVLARQSLDRLLDFPVLLGREPFLQTRRLYINTGSWNPDYLLQCTLDGELCRLSALRATCGNLRNRAVFLRDAKWYKFFRNAREDNFDFWYAIESGIPEIQAQALAISSFRDAQLISALCTFNDLHAIPWTPQLKEEIRALVLKIDAARVRLSSPEAWKFGNLLYLYGYLDIPLPPGLQDLVNERIYYTGLMDLLLEDKFTVERNETVDYIQKHTRAGYFPAYLPQVQSLAMLSAPREMLDPGSFLVQIVKAAIMTASGILELHKLYPEVFQYCINLYLDWAGMTLRRAVVVRVRNYLDDPEFTAIFDGTPIIAPYRIVAGYYVPGRTDLQVLRLNVANLQEHPKEASLQAKYRSVQQLVLYRPWSMSTRYPAGRTAFLRGQAKTSSTEWTNTTPEDRSYVLMTTCYRDRESSDQWSLAYNTDLFEVLVKHHNFRPASSMEEFSRRWDLAVDHVLQRLMSPISQRK